MSITQKEKASPQRGKAVAVNEFPESVAVQGMNDYPADMPPEVLDEGAPGAAPASPEDVIAEAIDAGRMVKYEDGSRRFWIGNGAYYELIPFPLPGAGVYLVRPPEKGKGDERREHICGPLWVDARSANAAGRHREMYLEWNDDSGKRLSEIILRAALAVPKDVTGMLLDGGLDMPCLARPNGAGAVAAYLLAYPAEKTFRRIERSSWLGRPGDCLIFPGPNGEVIGTPPEGEEIIYSPSSPQNDPVFLRLGTLEEWQEQVARPAWYSSRIRLAVCASFAAMFLPFVSDCEGGLHFAGVSGCGKSSMLRAAVSVLSKAEKGDATELRPWDGSAVSFELRCGAHDCWPMFNDEMGSMKERQIKDLPSRIYMCANGIGSDRGTAALNLRETLQWRTILISAAEHSPAHFLRSIGKEIHEGVLVRLPSIPAVPEGVSEGVCDFLAEGARLETDTVERKHWRKDVVAPMSEAAARRCYGTAGPEFVRKVIPLIQSKGGFQDFSDEMTARVLEWVEAYAPGGSDQVHRVGRRFALVAVVGELAIDLGILPWAPGDADEGARRCFAAWRESFEERAEEKDLLEAIPGLIEAYAARFAQVEEGTGKIYRGGADDRFLGFVFREREDGPPTRVYLVPDEADKMLRERFYQPRDVLERYKEEGLLVVKKGKERRLRVYPEKPLAKGMTKGPYYAMWLSAEMRERFDK